VNLSTALHVLTLLAGFAPLLLGAWVMLAAGVLAYAATVERSARR
jgi:hypothetical protein